MKFSIRFVCLMPVAVLAALFFCVSSSAATDYMAVIRQLEQLGRSPNPPLRDAILAQYLKIEPVSPGLIVVGSALPAEIGSASRLARELHARSGVTLMLIANYGGEAIPAYDGIVVDSNSKVVANFSLKMLTTEPDADLTVSIGSAIGKIIRYSKTHEWIETLYRFRGIRTAALRYGAIVGAMKLTYDTDFPRFIEDTKRVRNSIALFSPEAGRPSWILYDLPGQVYHEAITSSAYMTMGPEPISVIALTRHQLVTTYQGRSNVEAALNPAEAGGSWLSAVTANSRGYTVPIVGRCETAFAPLAPASLAP